jgi:RNA polymerase sigma factor (sigma-70 family)
MRWIMAVLAIAGLAMQGRLWLSDAGVSKTRDLHHAVQEQRAHNDTLRSRNASLEAEVVNLKYFAGLTLSQIAEVLDISPRTADRRWAYARAWLHKKLRD